jgi:UPF0755 protein
MSKKIIFFTIITIIILLAAGGLGGYQLYLNWGIDHGASQSTESQMFTVSKGENTKEIAKKLEAQGLIRKAFFFEKYVRSHDLDTQLRVGRYLLNPSMSPKEIAELIASGKTSENIVTIPEGFNQEQIAERLEESEIVSAKDFLAAVKKTKFNYAFLKDKPSSTSLEGYLFPDTYYLVPKTTTKEVIEKMLENFGNKLNHKLRTAIKKQNKTIFEIVIMASLIEKEVAKEKDRPIVAGIFYNRLDLGMPLESCATIQYILGSNKKRFSYAETRTPSAYNTYLNSGLPPTPICNPGLAALKAAIYSQDTDYLYFLSDNQGKTYYALTGEEHEANKVKYLK